MKSVIIPGATATANYFGILEMTIDDYSVTGSWRNCTIRGGQAEQAGERSCYGMGTWQNLASPMSSLLLYPAAAGASFVAGSKAKLYGV